MDWLSHPSDPRWWGSIIGSLLLSALCTWLSIAYAQRRNLIDQPGQRRSHSAPTPRGGGIGIVASALVFFCCTFTFRPMSYAMASTLILVAGIGWVDDHRPLSARLRIAVQFIAVSLLWAVLIAAQGTHGSRLPRLDEWIPMLGLTVLLVWSINLHNFMDGINGLLACQAIFIFVAFALSAMVVPSQPLLVLAAATLGFLPFNFPRARVFMGDVGSYALGLLIPLAVIAIGGFNEFEPPRSMLLTGAIASSGFVIDTSCNLCSRMLRGKRWYSAHREHLYQWMVRAGMSHARVVAWYMGWNLIVVAPVLWLLDHIAWSGDTGEGPAATGLAKAEIISTAAIYALGVALWIFGKRWCLDRVKSRGHA